MSLGAASGDMIFTLREEGSMIAGEVEAAGGGGFFGGPPGGVIEDGKIDGPNVSFRAGNTTYSGVVKGDVIELQRSTPPRRRPGGPAPSDANGPHPAIGPPPDGTDPSFGAGGARGGQPPAPLVLRRVTS